MAVLETSSIHHADTLQGYLIAEIASADVEIVERSHLERLLKEQDLQLVLTDAETVVRASRVARAQAILFHDTTEIRSEYSANSAGGWWVVSGNFRIVDVERGGIVLAGSASVQRNVTPELIPICVFLGLVVDPSKLHNELQAKTAERWQGVVREYAREVGRSLSREVMRARTATVGRAPTMVAPHVNATASSAG